MKAVLLLSVLLLQAAALCRAQAGADRLVQSLLHGYMKISIPLRNVTDTVNLQLDFTLIRIVTFDASTNIVSLTGWPQLYWNDYRLRWDPKYFDDIKMLRIPADKLWKPDILLYNSIRAKPEIGDVYAVVGHDGSIIWIPPAHYEFPCIPMDTENDVIQSFNCTAKLGSWTYDGNQLDVITKALDISTLSENPHFAVSDATAKRQKKHYPCCEEPYIHVDFSFKLTPKV